MYICPGCEPDSPVRYGYSIAYCRDHTPRRAAVRTRDTRSQATVDQHCGIIARVRAGATLKRLLGRYGVRLAGGSTVGQRLDSLEIGERALALLQGWRWRRHTDMVAQRLADAGLACAYCPQPGDDGDGTSGEPLTCEVTLASGTVDRPEIGGTLLMPEPTGRTIPVPLCAPCMMRK